MKFLQNTRKPVGLGGKIMLVMMNIGHAEMADWGFSYLDIAADTDALDVGCGGGVNLAKLLTHCKRGVVMGVDYSEVSVEKSKKMNAQSIAEGRCRVLQANVMNLPFEAASFDLVTAFETIYFWRDLTETFQEVRRVLRPQGKFLICNEVSGDCPEDEKWEKRIEGMKIYTADAIRSHLENAGFIRQVVHRHTKKRWLCCIAEKS